MKRSLQLILPLLFWSSLAFAQNVEGVIKDSHNEPIVGATVVVKGTQTYAVTDVDGKFSLNPPKTLPFTITVSSTGFGHKEVQFYELLEEPFEIILMDANVLNEVVVTARRRNETVQEVPIPISVVGGDLVEDAGAFNVSRVKELVPAVQLYSSNPRNTTLNIRGLGSTFGLTNDGIDPGVGFYVDGVYYARPAATMLDFIDIEQIEVLRGPQGTLFGKNTTAGAFNVTTRAASFTHGANLEVSYGNYGFVQAKASVTGALSKKFAGRISFSGTQRDGFLTNIRNQQSVNDLNNLGVRAQLLYSPNDNLKITLTGDNTIQKPNGYAQVIAGVVRTQRADYRQFDNIIADLGYQLPTRDPFDRIIDHDTPWKSGSKLGGVSLNVETKIGKGTLTSTSAWRYWNWDPSNDRDFTGLSVLRRSEGTSRHNNWSQEIRYAGDLSPRLSGVIGVFAIGQHLDSGPGQTEESGSAQWRFSQNSTSDLWKTPGLFEGYGVKTNSTLESLGAAVFGQIDWALSEKVHLLPGIRYNHDQKEVDYSRLTYGGLQTDDPALIALKKAVYTDQVFTADVDESNLSGQFTVTYRPVKGINSFATVSTSYKPVGVNLGGLPTSNGEVMTNLAQVKPEYVTHFEGGLKTNPGKSSTLNFVFYHTNVTDFQTQVQSPEVGVNRGYLANAEEVRVMGVELDGNIRFNKNLSIYGALAVTDGEYVSFKNAPVPLEETGGASAFKDISGSDLPGISKWSGSLGGEILSNPIKIFGVESKLFFAADNFYRSDFSSSPSPSKYLNVEGYYLLNARVGFRASQGLSLYVWGRNVLNKDYFEQLLPAGGNAGHYAAVLGDPRTYGVTIRYNY